MSPSGVIESLLSELQSITTDSPVYKYSPLLDQMGHYLMNTPGTTVNRNTVLSLEHIIANLHNSLLRNYSENTLESQVGDTRFLISELCDVLKSGRKPDKDFYKGLFVVGRNLRNIDAQLRRIKWIFGFFSIKGTLLQRLNQISQN